MFTTPHPADDPAINEGNDIMGHRKSINTGTAGHGAMPIPKASLKNGFLASSAIYGLGHGATEPADLDGQSAALFANMNDILRAAGGSFDDVIKVTIKMANPTARDIVNRHWEIAFPDPDSRPARHIDEIPLDRGGQLIAAEFLAVLDATN